MRSFYLDALAFGWLPILATTLMIGATWAIWYYAIGPGVEGSAAARLCARAPLACYIVPAVWRDCVLHGVAAMTLTGGPDFMLFIRERRRNQRAEELRQQEKQAEQERYQQERKEAAERYEREQQREQERHNQVIGLLQAALDQANTERQRAEERYRQDQQRAEERAAEERERAAQERERAAQERERAAQERERAAEERQAFLNTLTAVLARNGNGNGNGAPE